MKKRWIGGVPAAAGVALLAACAGGDADAPETALDRPDPSAALASLSADDLMEHITVLASDGFEGRAPGSAGEDSTVAYLEAQFRALGLQPGNPDGTYVQNVPLVGIRTTSDAHFEVGGQRVDLAFPTDFVAVSRHVTPEVHVEDSEMVFVGYGVVAPEYGWDDYKGMDVTGKTIVMLVNDPAVPAADGSLDPAMFNGEAMTYYGRWTYKYEIASEKGAAAAIIVHETGPAGYPWEVVSGSWGGENFDVVADDGNRSRVPVESWITLDQAKALFAAAGQDFDALKEAAKTTEFQPVDLGDATATFHLQNTTREVASRNVLAKLEGGDPEYADEYVIYTAHWDHLGKDESLPAGEDNIYNGALDNATGTAGLIELAEAYTQLPQAPPRSILFLAVTAEEQGLLGAKYYAQNPLYPLEKTLANINMDGLNQWGRTRDIVVVGFGNSTLDDLLATAAAEQDRTVVPDPEPEKGFFYRSDHFEFAKEGVPALYTDAGTEYLDKPAGYGDQKRAEYTANDYHKPSDEIKPDWDLSGGLQDLALMFNVGLAVASAETWPEWKPGTEFLAKRQAMLPRRD